MLINCPECKHEISNQALNCPSCGYPINKSKVAERGQLLTVKEAAAKLNVGSTTMYKLVNQSGFPCVRIGRKILVVEDELTSFINQYTTSKINIY